MGSERKETSTRSHRGRLPGHDGDGVENDDEGGTYVLL